MAIFGMLSIPLNIALENLEQVGFEGGKDIKNEDTSACIISSLWTTFAARPM